MSDDVNDLLDEFREESRECLEECEAALLKTERPETFQDGFQTAFRTFHSLKGLSGMFGLSNIEKTFHFLESLLNKYKEKDYFPSELVDYLFAGVDATSKLINGQQVQFELYDPLEDKNLESETIQSSSDLTRESPSVVDVNPKEARSLPGAKQTTQHILYLVDDNMDLLNTMADCIRTSGLDLEVCTFSSAEQALEAFDRAPLHNQPDVIVSDIVMQGGISGLEYMEIMNRKNSNIPFTLLTGHLDEDVYNKAIEQGAYALLAKPMREVELKFVITSSIKYKESLDLVRKSLKFMFYVFGASHGLSQDDKKLLENEIQWVMQRIEDLKSYGKAS